MIVSLLRRQEKEEFQFRFLVYHTWGKCGKTSDDLAPFLRKLLAASFLRRW